MKRLKLYVSFLLIGALSYWLTDIIIHFFFRGKLWIISLTFLVPLIVSLTYFYFLKKVGNQHSVMLAFFMILGIWLFGPLGMSFDSFAMGGNFGPADDFKGFLSLWELFPLSTWMMSAYSGSMGGLILTTLLLIIFAIGAEIRYRISKKTSSL